MLVEREFDVRPLVDAAAWPIAARATDGVYLDPKMRDYVLDLVPPPATRGRRLPEPGAADRLRRLAARDPLPRPRRQGDGAVARARLRDARRRQGDRADVLRHRLVPTYEAEAEEVTSDELVARLLDRVEVP
jgi:MoxR-like ATPase